MRVLTAATAVVFIMAGTASAQANDAMLKCRAMSDKERRLACYDDIADAMTPAMSPEAAAKAKEAAFGAEKLQAKARAAAGEEEKLDTLAAAIARIRSDPSGNKIFDLDNGQTWRVMSGSRTLPPVHAGDAVQLSRGAVGGYRLKLIGAGRTVQVKRVR